MGSITGLVIIAMVLAALPARSAGERIAPGDSFRECAVCPEMVVIPAGSFIIGSPQNEIGHDFTEAPSRRVAIPKFAVGRFDVKRAEWAAFAAATHRPVRNGCTWTGRTRSKVDVHGSWRNLGFPQRDDHPVVCVTWNDARGYVRWLSRVTHHQYRLLSESEWEYAARAGSTTPYPWGATATHERANFGADQCCSGLAAGRDKWVYTSPVTAFAPNAFGLYDMNGNVLQWVQDCFSPTYSDLPSNGAAYEKNVTLHLRGVLAELRGSKSCDYRMLRGGDWGDPPVMIRSAARNFPPPGTSLQEYASGGIGFRVARTLHGQQSNVRSERRAKRFAGSERRGAGPAITELFLRRAVAEAWFPMAAACTA